MSYWDPAEKRTRYAMLQQALLTERSTFDTHWRELGECFLPRRTRFIVNDRNKGGRGVSGARGKDAEGERRNNAIIDSTGRFAARTLSSGLHAGLTSPARPWMKLTTPDAELAETPAVKAYLHEVTERMLRLFAVSNLYNVLPLVYQDLGVFGTAAMSITDDTRDLFRCYSYPIGSFALGVDARGLATTFCRDFEMTVRQVVDAFVVQADRRTLDWSRCSITVKRLWEQGQTETPIPVTWIVKPNDDYDANRLDAKFLPWASCHFETQGPSEHFLRESGFRTFPIMAPRWDLTGEDTYGTDCPGMTCLGDVKQLQIMHRHKARLVHTAVDPPMKAPTSMRTLHTSTVPGDVTFVDARDGQNGFSPVYETRLEGYQHLVADIGEVQYRVQRAFYEDLFLMLQRSDDRLGAARPTAREIDERHEEKLLALGPVLERTNDELLDPIVERVFSMMEQAEILPEAPPDLQGIELRVEYVSVLAEAQQQVGLFKHDKLLALVRDLVDIFPEFKAKIDPFATIDDYARRLGVNPSMVLSTKQAQATMQAAAQLQQQQLAAEQAATMATANQKASQTPLGGNTALTRMLEANGAGGAGVPPADGPLGVAA